MRIKEEELKEAYPDQFHLIRLFFHYSIVPMDDEQEEEEYAWTEFPIFDEFSNKLKVGKHVTPMYAPPLINTKKVDKSKLKKTPLLCISRLIRKKKRASRKNLLLFKMIMIKIKIELKKKTKIKIKIKTRISSKNRRRRKSRVLINKIRVKVAVVKERNNNNKVRVRKFNYDNLFIIIFIIYFLDFCLLFFQTIYI